MSRFPSHLGGPSRVLLVAVRLAMVDLLDAVAVAKFAIAMSVSC
jgi:hypothetical protein